MTPASWAIAVTSRKRSENLPELRTVAEEGLEGFEVASWFGILAPAGTPKSVVGKLHEAISKGTSTNEFKRRLETLGAVPMSEGPAEFSALIARELAKWEKIVRASGARVE